MGGIRAVALLAGAMCLAGCGDSDRIGDVDARGSARSAAAEGLDALALESGALPDAAAIDPAGRYGQRYEGGSDRLCLVPDGAARGRYRFGAESLIGQEEYCRGTGRARLSADKLLLRFEGAGKDCLVVARYEGDKIVFPGALDIACAALCSSRGSLAGVGFARVDRDVAAARAQRDSRNDLLCR
jgi:hypothetical protein